MQYIKGPVSVVMGQLSSYGLTHGVISPTVAGEISWAERRKITFRAEPDPLK